MRPMRGRKEDWRNHSLLICPGCICVWRPWAALCCLLIGGALIRLSTAWFHRMFGGVTGDLLGATNEISEILFIVIVPVVLFR